MKLLFLLLVCGFSSAVKHSLQHFFIASSGATELPQFQAVLMVDNLQAGYCDNNKKILEPNYDWAKQIISDSSGQSQFYSQHCYVLQPAFLQATISNLMTLFNQTEGSHFLQRMSACEWDDETNEITSFVQYAYDGEDFIVLDLKNQRWIAAAQQARITKENWDTNSVRMMKFQTFLTDICPKWLKMNLGYAKSSLQRTELPSVSLLQKSPSSPVTCHATGFYPDKAMLFWRKDGEELHEDVDHGETLPNHDGTFQMSTDLRVSSIPPEDWRRYDCVFQLSGVEVEIVTRLNQAVIRSNLVKPSDKLIIAGWAFGAIAIVVAIVVTVAFLHMRCSTQHKDHHNKHHDQRWLVPCCTDTTL